MLRVENTHNIYFEYRTTPKKMSVTPCLFTGRVVTKYYSPDKVLSSLTSNSFNPLHIPVKENLPPTTFYTRGN